MTIRYATTVQMGSTPGVTVTTTSLPEAVQGTAYSATLQASGGAGMGGYAIGTASTVYTNWSAGAL